MIKVKTLKINQEKCVKSLFGVIILSIFLYVYMVNVVTFNVLSRSSLVKSISAIESGNSDLETNLISLDRQNSRELATEFGLSQPIINNTIVVRDYGTRLTLNE